MTDREMRNALKKGSIYDQYLLVGDEPLLIENSISAIKEALKIDESFDLDVYSLSETPVEEITEKLYLVPFASAKRLLIVKDLEEIDEREIKQFASYLNKAPFLNCLIIVFKLEKDSRGRKHDNIYSKLGDIFKNGHIVSYDGEKEFMHKWIVAIADRKKLNLSKSIIDYLENEFKNDVTGLKNEFDKIENYLYEAKQLGIHEMKDLGRGLCDFDKYQMVNAFLQGKQEALSQFEELKPYLQSYAEIVDALIRGTIYRTRFENEELDLKGFVEGIQNIDRKVKASSYFDDLYIELFFIRNMMSSSKGGVHGR